jgi:hypothetical protein
MVTHKTVSDILASALESVVTKLEEKLTQHSLSEAGGPALPTGNDALMLELKQVFLDVAAEVRTLV